MRHAAASAYNIQGYGDGGFRVGGQKKTGSIILVGQQIFDWPIKTASEITAEGLSALWTETASPPEILLVGTGAEFVLLTPSLRNQLREHGIVADAMDTGAACRTYNVLVAEERKVAAALLAV